MLNPEGRTSSSKDTNLSVTNLVTFARCFKMTQKHAFPSSDELSQAAITALEEKKGYRIILLDLKEVENTVCDFFVICHGNSDTQVSALADSVEREVKTKLRERPWHIEGKENKSWVLLDYSNVVVHIFQREVRDFYKLEDLWADAKSVLIREDYD